MTSYLKILLLLIFISAPALDIAILDNQEATDHLSEAFHEKKIPQQPEEIDLHCICHVLHHGVTVGKVFIRELTGTRKKISLFSNAIAIGLHPKPGLHPPTREFS